MDLNNESLCVGRYRQQESGIRVRITPTKCSANVLVIKDTLKKGAYENNSIHIENECEHVIINITFAPSVSGALLI